MENEEKHSFIWHLAVWIVSIFSSYLLILIIPLLLLIPLTFWTDRTLDFWCTYFSHHAVNIPGWISFLITVFFNILAFILNIISEIVRACMGV